MSGTDRTERGAEDVLRARTHERMSVYAGAPEGCNGGSVSAGDLVQMSWMPGRGSCPGAVDLAALGPLGRIERAVTLPEALTLGAVVDLLCPTPPMLHAAISRLPLQARDGRPEA